MRVCLCLFGPLHLALGPNCKSELFSFFNKKSRQKSESLDPVISHLAFVVGKLWPENHKINN